MVPSNTAEPNRTMRIAPMPAPEMKNIPPNNNPRSKSDAPIILQPLRNVRMPLTHAVALSVNAAMITNSKLLIANTAGNISMWLAQSPDVSQSPLREITVHAEKITEIIPNVNTISDKANWVDMDSKSGSQNKVAKTINGATNHAVNTAAG